MLPAEVGPRSPVLGRVIKATASPASLTCRDCAPLTGILTDLPLVRATPEAPAFGGF